MKTVFVIGAGASAEVNLPVGSELKNRIADSLRPCSRGGTDAIWDAIGFMTTRAYPDNFTINQLNAASEHIRNAMPGSISIDNFLDVHGDNTAIVECGKLAIVHSILDAESKSAIFVDRSCSSKRQFEGEVENTWFNGFMQLLTEGCRRSNLERRLSSIVLIIFNYDRCVEHYICHALQTYYGMNEIDAAELLLGIEIYHPYGTVGSLPHLGREHPVGFGDLPHASSLPGLAGQIKTFTEGTDEASSDILAIRRHVASAPRLVFLGFAFHKINMNLLIPEGPDAKRREGEIFATSMGLSVSDSKRVSHSLAIKCGVSNGDIYLHNMACRDLFKEHWRGLAYT